MAIILPIIPLKLASPGKKEQPDLCIGPTELATTTKRRVVASLPMKFEILLVFKSHLGFSHERQWHGKKMAAIPAMLACPSKKEQTDLCIGLAELATTARKGVDAFLVIKVEILLVFKSHFLVFFS
jgi:hypothetical protein